MSAVSPRIRQLLPGLLVSGGFTAWFILRADWGSVGGALRGVHLGWVAAVGAALFLEHVVRAIRWRVLVRDIAPEVTTFRLWVATVIGMAFNVVLPFRIGDFVRPWLIARERGTSYVTFLTVAVIERVFDIFGLTGQVLLLGLLAPADADGVILSRLRYASGFGLLGLTALLVFMGMAAQESRTRALYEGIVRFLPGPLRRRFLSLYEGFAQGLASVRRRSSLFLAGGWSLLHWTNGTLAIWLLCRAFDVQLPFAAAAFTNIALAVSVGLPQAPGYLGVFHTAIEAALRTWGIDAGFAQAFAVLFWFVSFVPVTLTGLALFAREGITVATIRAQIAAWLAPPASGAAGDARPGEGGHLAHHPAD